jgi:hypothetical protein
MQTSAKEEELSPSAAIRTVRWWYSLFGSVPVASALVMRCHSALLLTLFRVVAHHFIIGNASPGNHKMPCFTTKHFRSATVNIQSKPVDKKYTQTLL